MIISQFPTDSPDPSLSAELNRLTKERANRWAKDTIGAVGQIRAHISNARQYYRDVIMEYPDLDDFLKKRINELDKLISQLNTVIV